MLPFCICLYLTSSSILVSAWLSRTPEGYYVLRVTQKNDVYKAEQYLRGISAGALNLWWPRIIKFLYDMGSMKPSLLFVKEPEIKCTVQRQNIRLCSKHLMFNYISDLLMKYRYWIDL